MKYTSVLVLTKICHNLIFPQRVNDKFMHFLDFFSSKRIYVILGIYVQTDNKENACCAFIFYLYTIHCQFLKIDISRWKEFEKNEKSLKTSWWNPRHNLKTSIRKCISIERYNNTNYSNFPNVHSWKKYCKRIIIIESFTYLIAYLFQDYVTI